MAIKKFLVDLDLVQNQILNPVLQNLSTDPASGKEGQKYFNTTSHKERIYSNGAWRDNTYDLPAATNSIRGGIRVGSHLNITSTDVLNVNEATNSTMGVIRIATDTEAGTGTSETLAINPKQLKTAIQGLPTPMQFKGTVGTGGTIEWADLPAAADSEGFTYKVITDHTTAPVCEAGDTIVSNGTVWVVIPSGDEPSGTVTSVGLSVPTGLSVSGSPITTSGTLAVTLTSGYEIPTTAHVQNFGKIKVGSTTTSADAYNDTITFAAGGDASVSISGKTVTYSVTDEKVKQSAISDNAAHPILLKNSANSTEETAVSKFASGVTINPSTGTITAPYFSGNGSGLTNVPVISHTHGNIANGGTLTDTAAAAAGNDYVVIRDADTDAIQTSTIKAVDVADAVTKMHTHSTLTLTETAQTYDGSHTLKVQEATSSNKGIVLLGASGGAATYEHIHGKISNDGCITSTTQSSDVTIASGDKLVVTDSSDSNRVVRTSAAFDGSTTAKYLSQKGTFESISDHAVIRYEVSNPALTATSGVCTWTVTHNIGRLNVIASVIKVSSGDEVYCAITKTSNNVLTIKINSSANISAGTYSVVVIG